MENKYLENNSIVEYKDDMMNCSYDATDYLEERFWLVSIIGTSVATLSIIQNSFLFAVLITK